MCYWAEIYRPMLRMRYLNLTTGDISQLSQKPKSVRTYRSPNPDADCRKAKDRATEFNELTLAT